MVIGAIEGTFLKLAFSKQFKSVNEMVDRLYIELPGRDNRSFRSSGARQLKVIASDSFEVSARWTKSECFWCLTRDAVSSKRRFHTHARHDVAHASLPLVFGHQARAREVRPLT